MRNELSEEKGEEIVLTKLIDDTPYLEHCARLRHINGKGIIRDNKGAAAYRRLLSISMEEASALNAVCDPDWMEFWHSDSDASLMRLVKRYPHWVVCEGGGLT